MGRKYTRKTNRETPTLDILNRAADLVADGQTFLRMAASLYSLTRTTLWRFIRKRNTRNTEQWHSNLRQDARVFNSEMETDLANHIVRLADQFFGLNREKCCQLAYEFAVINGIIVPGN